MPGKQEPTKVRCAGQGCEELVTASKCRTGLCKKCYRKRYYAEHREDERQTMADWRSKNAEYNRERWRAFAEKNADHLREARLTRYRENQEALVARAAEYRAANRQAIQDRERERRRNDPNWPLRNRENARRRAKAPDRQHVNYAAILAQHGMTCHICGDEIPSVADLHFDHVVPLARGGVHSEDNIRPAHALCNMRKGARTA